LAALAKIDGGRLAIAFEQALKRVAQDCDDRPGEKKERVVSLHVNVKPMLDEDGMCEDCSVQVLINDSVPKRKSKPYNVSLRKGGMLLYHEEALDNHAQEALPFDRDSE
jgi:hypothetical protein